MKNLFLLLIAAFGITAAASAQTAEFKFTEETHDFGKIPQGKPVVYTFKFTNTGDEPLIIKNVTASCGCTVPDDYTKTPVKKGESGQITVKYNAAVKTPFIKNIDITSNAKTPKKTIYIKGEVVDSDVKTSR